MSTEQTPTTDELTEFSLRAFKGVDAGLGQAIAEEIGRTILLARAGETFQLSDTPIWVRPVAVAMSLAQGSVT